MPDDTGDKTEQPTDRRRTEAREKGNVARSSDLNAAALMAATAGLIALLGMGLVEALAQLLRASLTRTGHSRIDVFVTSELGWEIGRHLAESVLPWMLLLAATAVFANVLQVGFLVAPSALEPKFSRIHPWEGVKRIVSMQALMKLGTSLGKLIVLVAIAVAFVAYRFTDIVALQQASPGQVLSGIHELVALLAFLLALGLIVLALLDFLFQRWKHEQDLMMTKQEVREEMKNMEGDPHIRQRRRDAHRKLATARELQEVRNADVVVTNPTHISVALKYDPDVNDAPIVVAKGMGEIALRIREIAREHDVPILERKELARALYRDVRVGRPIPVDLYGVFVEIMAYVYRITGRTPKGLD